MLKRLMVMCFAVLLGSLGCIVVTPHVRASDPAAIVYVDPHMVVNQALIPNTTFNVSVKVDNIPADPGLAGVQFELTWDPNLLNCTGIQEILFHSVTPPDSWDNIWSIKLKYNNTGGYADYAMTWQDVSVAIADGYAPISGNQTVANLTFKVKAVGKCALHFDPSNTILGDTHVPSQPIPQELVDGFFSNAPPPPPALLHVDPPKISNVSLTPGNDFTVNVSITKASGVYGLQFELGFNASIVEASTVMSGSFIPPSAILTTQIDNATGFVMFNVSLSSSLDGNGTLAVINFLVEGIGGTTLHLYDVQLVDSFGQLLSCTTSDGSFNNVFLAKLAIDPPEIIDPTLVPPATFMVNVTIEDVKDMYGYGFNLTFDPKILICLQVQIIDVLNETYYIPNQNVDNTIGFIMVNVTYYPPAVPLDVGSATPLVSVKFRVKAMGGTNLTLTNTELVDSMGQPITHEVHNGYFQSLIVDIGVVDVFASPTAIYKGQNTNITIIVANKGNSTESFILNVYYNNTLLTTMNVTGLAPNANTTVTVPWSTSTVQWGKYLVSVQVPPLPYETHTADNTFVDGIVKVKIPGDLNGDDVVDILDSISLSNAYGSSPGQPNWYPDADLNGDGVVNILDAIALANNFGARM